MQQNIINTQHPIDSKIHLTSSKRLSIYAILLATLSDSACELQNLFFDDDIAGLLQALKHLGVAIQFDDDLSTCTIAGCKGQFPNKQSNVNLGNNSQIAIHLLILLAFSRGSHYINAQPSISNLDLEELIEILRCLGTQTIPEYAKQLPFSLIGSDLNHAGGEILLNSHLHPDMVSAILFCSTFAPSQINLVLPEKHHFQNTIHLACELMNEFGVCAHPVHPSFVKVLAPESYHRNHYSIEADFNLACFFLAATGVCQGRLRLEFKHTFESKLQGYKMTHFITRMGGNISEDADGMTVVCSKPLNGININLHRFDEIFYALLALAPFCKTPSFINLIGQHRKVDLQQLHDCLTLLKHMNIQFESGETWLKIYPSRPKDITIDAGTHPLLALTCHIIGLKTPGMSIQASENLARFYPGFYPMWHQFEASLTTRIPKTI